MSQRCRLKKPAALYIKDNNTKDYLKLHAGCKISTAGVNRAHHGHNSSCDTIVIPAGISIACQQHR